MKNIIGELNKAFESRIRLGIMSVLMVDEQVTFNRLKELLGVTDGNLASHLKSLQKLNYIITTKAFINNKPNTTYSASATGRKAFKEHIDALEELIKGN